MKTRNNNQNVLRAFVDATANMLEVMPGDILILRPRPNTATVNQ